MKRLKRIGGGVAVLFMVAALLAVLPLVEVAEWMVEPAPEKEWSRTFGGANLE
jgi:hypothetical protein